MLDVRLENSVRKEAEISIVKCVPLTPSKFLIKTHPVADEELCALRKVHTQSLRHMNLFPNGDHDSDLLRHFPMPSRTAIRRFLASLTSSS